MSGGTYDYLYSRIRDAYPGYMYDKELDNMMKDLVPVLKDLEWWTSGDIGEEDYRKTAKEFKDKWFGKRDDMFKIAIKETLEGAIKEIDSL